MSVFLHDWDGDDEATVLAAFDAPKDALDGASLLIASYTYEDYSGYGFVLFERDGKLYEVHGSRCSCYGLEGQWEPEEALPEAILQRVDRGAWEYGDTDLRQAIRQRLSADDE